MKPNIRIPSLFFVVALLLVVSCEKDTVLMENPSYEVYDDLMVANSHLVVNGTTFVAIDNFDSLNEILQPNDNIENPKVIVESDFKGHVAIAVIKQYHNVCSVSLKLDTVLFVKDKIQVFYDHAVDFGDVEKGITCAMFAQPTLVILTNKKDYATIDFYENGLIVDAIIK